MKITICLVEDTPDLLENLSHFLCMENYEVWPCRDGREALVKLEDKCPHLIMTDLLMPGIKGMEFIEIVRSQERLKDIPIAIFSAKPFQEYQEEIRNFTKIARIKKPASLEEILNVITFLLHGDQS